MKQTLLVGILLVICNVCICININLSKTVAEDLLPCEKISKMVFIETDWSQSIRE